MKEKLATGNGHYLQTLLPLGCWKPVCKKKQNVWKRMLKQHQYWIDTIVAGAAIGLMFLAGIWLFLIQLAEYSG